MVIIMAHMFGNLDAKLHKGFWFNDISMMKLNVSVASPYVDLWMKDELQEAYLLPLVAAYGNAPPSPPRSPSPLPPSSFSCTWRVGGEE